MRISRIASNLIIPISICVMGSCQKAELPIKKPATGDSIIGSVNVGQNYEKVIYFDLGTNAFVGESSKLNWDLGFSCQTEDTYIILNAGKLMMAVQVTHTFEELNSPTSYLSQLRVDHPTGRRDSLAIKGPGVYLVDRGVDFDGNTLGYVKLEITENSNNQVTGRIANLNGTNEQTINLPKNTTYNFIYLKWNNSDAFTTPTIEPEKDRWDIVFTQYSEIFYEPDYMPYMVFGCLLNQHQTKAVLVHDITYEELTLEKAEAIVLSTDLDAIGYNWKYYNFDTNIYTVDFEKVYLIQDQEGYYYKLRFIDFYSTSGIKGNPTFEFQRL